MNQNKFNLPEEFNFPITITSKLFFNIEKINNLDYITDKKLNYSITGWGFIDKINSKDSNIYIILKRNDQYLKYITRSDERIDVAEYFKNEDYKYSGFIAYICLDTLEKGEYQVGLFIQNTKFIAIDFSEQYIEI